MQVSQSSGYSSQMMMQNVSMSMIKRTSDMTAQAVDKLMSSVIPQGASAPMRPGVGQKLDVYA